MIFVLGLVDGIADQGVLAINKQRPVVEVLDLGVGQQFTGVFAVRFGVCCDSEGLIAFFKSTGGADNLLVGSLVKLPLVP
ncbi:MAG: hypothetical protein R2864_14635 [Syntrophotaleaceae bacterium]